MGQLRRRGNVWWIRYYRNGRRHEESSRSGKKGVARDLLRRREGKIADGIPVSSAMSRYRFDDAARDIVAEYTTNNRRSLRNLKNRIDRHLTPWFAGRRMTDITTSDVLAFTKARLEAKASPAEVNRELSVLRRMFSLAIKGNRLSFKPHIPMLAERNVRTGFVDREQLEALRSNLPAFLRPVITFAFAAGWRIPSEVLPLEWRSVDRDLGEARLDPGTTKNTAGRVFPFTDELRTLFDELWKEHEALAQKGTLCPWVFQKNGARIKDFRRAWEKACEAAGCPGRIPHDLRRSAVRNMERSGLSRSVAMQLTGHKTESVYRRYAITSEGDLREGVSRLNAAANATGTKKGQSARSGARRGFRRSA